MNISNTLKFTPLVLLAAFVLAVTSAQANYQYQSQSGSTSTSTSVSCNGGNCTGSSSSESSLELHQSQSTDAGNGMHHNTMHQAPRHNRNNNWKDTSGEVSINWDHRGGTCHVRYGESTSRGYRYSTSASCDDGGMTIGGLQTGKNYRVQYRKDSGAWSAPKTYRAE